MSQFMTHEATEAMAWMTARMPDNIYKIFADEMEAAMRVTAMRFGFDNELLTAFNVDRLVARREELQPADDAYQVFQAHVYFTGDKHYAVIGTGQIFHKCVKGSWRPARLTLADVKERSITRVTETVKIKAKYL